MANSNITKKALAQSLKELGATKLFDKITIADITEHCGVNRQTFYYHFNDKYELLSWIYTQELFVPLTDGLDFENWGERLVELFHIMKKEQKFFRNTVKSSNNFFAEYLQKAFIELFQRAFADLNTTGKQMDEKEKDIYARFLSYGLTGVILDWTMKGMKESEEELNYFLQKVAFNTEKIGHELYLYHNGNLDKTQ